MGCRASQPCISLMVCLPFSYPRNALCLVRHLNLSLRPCKSWCRPTAIVAACACVRVGCAFCWQDVAAGEAVGKPPKLYHVQHAGSGRLP
jgi:hypothetical protein